MMKKPSLITGMITAFTLFPVASFANDPTIQVRIELTTPSHSQVWGVGFSVNNKSTGSLGRTANKTGPAGGHYSFGIQAEEKVSCGSDTLTQNCVVNLIYDGKTCHIEKITPM